MALTNSDLKAIGDLIDSKLGVVITDIGTLKADVAELKTDVAELKTDVAELKTDVAELKTDVAVLKKDVAELKTDVAVLKTDMDAVKILQIRFELEQIPRIRVALEGFLVSDDKIKASNEQILSLAATEERYGLILSNHETRINELEKAAKK